VGARRFRPPVCVTVARVNAAEGAISAVSLPDTAFLLSAAAAGLANLGGMPTPGSILLGSSPSLPANPDTLLPRGLALPGSCCSSAFAGAGASEGLGVSSNRPPALAFAAAAGFGEVAALSSNKPPVGFADAGAAAAGSVVEAAWLSANSEDPTALAV
jgi:hypothetical protein